MAKPSNKSSETKITRIKATDSEEPKARAKKQGTSPVKSGSSAKSADKSVNPLRAIGVYFKGAWSELRQVRWPDRKTTWAMTGALLAFTGFFVVVILLLDAGFKYLFKLLIGA